MNDAFWRCGSTAYHYYNCDRPLFFVATLETYPLLRSLQNSGPYWHKWTINLKKSDPKCISCNWPAARDPANGMWYCYNNYYCSVAYYFPIEQSLRKINTKH